MKKTGIVLLAVLLLMSTIACQPTPTEEFVVNKKDSGAAAKLQADTDESAESRAPSGRRTGGTRCMKAIS